MKTYLRTAALLFLLLTALLLSGCRDNATKNPSPSAAPSTPVTDPTPTPSPTPAADPEEAVRTYWSADQLTQAWGPNQVVEHLFFHPVIAYPQWAFHDCGASQSERDGLDDWMVTVDEFNKILQELYERDYILVNMCDVWVEQPNENGEPRMVRNTLMLPEGKKPLVFSFDDVNYYTKETFLTQDLDATTILDQFVRAHPDFSLNGAKGCFSLTGYEGILGYRTQNDIDIGPNDPARPAFDANRQREIEAVKPVIQRLKETGWTFGSHTWGHIRLSTRSMEQIQTDTLRWAEEVGSLVGPTNILFYPHGARPDGDRDQGENYGEQFRWLQSQGFRIFASVGINSYSQIKTGISAVICDRLHPDGTTLRWARSKYLQFYDAKDIIDLSVRPDLDYDFNR